MKRNVHGGNIYKKARELGMAEENILDFSANISPLGLPSHIKKAMTAAIEGTVNYPDPECTALRESISRQDHVRADWIACGNGGADLLYRLAFGLTPKKVLLPVPAFVEYEEAMTAAGAEMVYVPMGRDMKVPADLAERINGEIDLVVLCNPNNPTGLLTGREQIVEVLKRARQYGAMVMVDECFLEMCRRESEYTVKPWLGEFSNLMILKSFTKLYAIPGVRLGYLLCSSPAVIEKINRAGQAWPVSHIAQCAGVAALAQPAYKKAVVEAVEKELAFMKEELSSLPVKLFDGQANYLFFRAPGITDLDDRLEKKGIMIRNCSNYVNLQGDYWRVAVKSHEENKKLLDAMRDVLSVEQDVLGVEKSWGKMQASQ
ncbi:MAG: threonine-phosphate decarboxylase CobD [Eubacteriales bacterium]|nr:threonine-phosphate decarboxylase CobD [Eubacteriales bacterium]